MKMRAALIAMSLMSLLATTASAHPATGIVVDRAGNVYFSDLETIWKLDAHGRKTVFRAGVSGRHVHELSIDDAGNIYGADISYNPATGTYPSAVWKMTPEGKLTYLQEPTENLPRGTSIWRDRAGNMYFVDQNNHTKTQTLVLRREPGGNVTTLAGSAYGHKDGSGALAHFGSVGGITFGSDGSLYLTDGDSVRRVSKEGTVTTIAKNLNFQTADDKPTAFGGAHGNLTGLTVDLMGNVYVADAGNRRLLKITSAGKADVVYRVEPPFFPNGVFAAANGDVYVLEVGFELPNISSGPRVRRLSRGKNEIIAVVGGDSPSGIAASGIDPMRPPGQTAIESYSIGMFIAAAILLSGGLAVSSWFIWKRKGRERRA